MLNSAIQAYGKPSTAFAPYPYFKGCNNQVIQSRDDVQAKLAEALHDLGRESMANNLLRCGTKPDGEYGFATFRCDSKYCHRCRQRKITKYRKIITPLLDSGQKLHLMTLGVSESKQQDWSFVKQACDMRSRLLNLAPFKDVNGALCSIEISVTEAKYFTHMHVLYLGDLTPSRGKSPKEKITAWQSKNFNHSHYDDKPVGNSSEDLRLTLSYLYKGFKDAEFPLEAIQPYVEATLSTRMVTPRGCFRNV